MVMNKRIKPTQLSRGSGYTVFFPLSKTGDITVIRENMPKAHVYAVLGSSCRTL